MKNSLFIGRFLFLICTLLTLPSHANACWVEKIQSVNGSIRIYLNDGYKTVPIYITRNEKGTFESPNSNTGAGYFELRIGDRAFINLHHDNCTYTAEARPEGIGVSLRANSHPHGMSPSTSQNFLLATP